MFGTTKKNMFSKRSLARLSHFLNRFLAQFVKKISSTFDNFSLLGYDLMQAGTHIPTLPPCV
jgi:hypothetical protein